MEPSALPGSALVAPAQEGGHAQFSTLANWWISVAQPLPKAVCYQKAWIFLPGAHPIFWLTFKGKLVAGPASRGVLESFVNDPCTKPEKAEELAGVLGKAYELPKRSRDRGDHA